MSSLKIDAVKKERSVLNTTIDAKVFDEFKKSCKSTGVQMNTLIECFMRQYTEGCFYLNLGNNIRRKNNMRIEFEEDRKDEKTT